MLLFRAPENKKASVLILLLLVIILAININNIWYSSYMYRVYLGVAGFSQGMVLLLGPILYLYVRSVMVAAFKFRPIQLLHVLPYIVVFGVIIYNQQGHYASRESEIEIIDAFMNGEYPGGFASIARFSVYFIHLLLYLFIIKQIINHTLKKDHTLYLVPLDVRVKWLKTLTLFISTIVLALVTCIIYIVIAGHYSVVGNFICTLLLSAIVYLIAYQALSASPALIPNFNVKYGSVKLPQDTNDSILEEIIDLFENEKIYTDSELNISALAKRLGISSHLLSRIINNHLNQSFSQLLNHYRIEEFKRRVAEVDLNKYSILGIAYDVGYNSKSSFYTAFKKSTGKTPTEFAKKIKK